MKHYSDFSVCLCAFDWQDTLEDFFTLISDKTFNKLPYADWKYLWGIAKSPDLVEIEVFWAHDDGCRVDMEMIFHFKDGITKNYICANGDNSFGDFLYENYLYGVELDTMHEDEMKYTIYDGTYAKHDWDCAKVSINCESDSPITDVWDSVATKADASSVSSLQDTVDKLITTIAAATSMNEKINTTNNNKKENSVMKFNFDFGPVNSSMVRMSLYGLAVKNKAGTWVSYDAKAGDIMDVDILNFDGAKFLYKMPVATKDIAVGDVVIHNGIPMFVIGVATNDAYITAVDPINGERKDIMLPKSPFGFNFATKVVNFLGNLNSGATNDNPFGNLGLMLMLSEDGNGVKDMLPLMLMANGGSVDMSNPLMMYALMSGDGKMGDMLPFLFMMNANNTHNVAPAHTCTCGGHCNENYSKT